jgi:hypothetical protein
MRLVGTDCVPLVGLVVEVLVDEVVVEVDVVLVCATAKSGSASRAAAMAFFVNMRFSFNEDRAMLEGVAAIE